jgi:hypothetical protein
MAKKQPKDSRWAYGEVERIRLYSNCVLQHYLRRSGVGGAPGKFVSKCAVETPTTSVNGARGWEVMGNHGDGTNSYSGVVHLDR